MKLVVYIIVCEEKVIGNFDLILNFLLDFDICE